MDQRSPRAGDDGKVGGEFIVFEPSHWAAHAILVKLSGTEKFRVCVFVRGLGSLFGRCADLAFLSAVVVASMWAPPFWLGPLAVSSLARCL